MNDLKEFKHGEEGTHSACKEQVDKLGGKTGCCGCNKHKCKVNLESDDDDYVHDGFGDLS